MAKNAFAPLTPGEMLKEEFLVEYGLSQNELGKGCRYFTESVSPRSSTIGAASLPIPHSD